MQSIYGSKTAIGDFMKQKSLLLPLLILAFASIAFAQDTPVVALAKKWHTFDYKTKLVPAAELKKFTHEELQLMRGVVFGKRGRIFKERFIQSYLEKQSWYKANESFSNASLTATERKNIDSIREYESGFHYYVEPGDLRFWEGKKIPPENIPTTEVVGAAGMDVLIAEFEAIHGKTFPEQEWMQKYFDDRYWYRRNPNYHPSILGEIDRENMRAFMDERDSGRKLAVSPGDMDKFQNALLKPEQLVGLRFHELRIMRNEFWARRGKRFDTPGYRAFYEWQEWYRPLKNQRKVKLNEIETVNVKTIEDYENLLHEKITTEPLAEDSLSGLFAEDLQMMRNEIFARHGWIFKNKSVQKEFASMVWYKPDPTFTAERVKEVLSSTEFANIAKIKDYESVAISKFVLVEG